MNKKILVTIFTLIFVLILGVTVQAKSSENLLKEEVEFYANSFDENDLENITKEDILKIYDEITEEYTNDEIADMLIKNKEEIVEGGVEESILTAGAEFIRNTDQDEIRDILENDIDYEQIKQRLNNNENIGDILTSMAVEAPVEQKATITLKILLSNSIVKSVVVSIIILFIYMTIIRWSIYNKANKHGFAAIIPLYRQITLYKICGLSPWLMLLWLVPIFRLDSNVYYCNYEKILAC